MSPAAARVTSRGAERWVRGHPWIYRSEVTSHSAEAGVVPVEGLDLRKIEPGSYTFVCLPLDLVGSDGAPARAILID